jgi:polyisoprenoid-binding protein YceI
MASTAVQPTVELPEPGTYELDPSHTSVRFTARHLMVTRVHGELPVAGGTVTIAADPAQSAVEATVDVAGLHTGDAGRDEHLRSADFFDVEHHPTAAFRSTRVERTGGGHRLHGDLTIRGVTRPVVLDLEYLGASPDPWGGTRIGFTATTQVHRRDWGLEWNVALDTGGVLVGDKVTLSVDAQAIKR